MALILTLTGAGAMASPRFAPAGLLVEDDGVKVVLDGGGDPNSFPDAIDGWLVTDERAELIREIRKLAKERGVKAGVERLSARGLTLDPMRVIHTSHPIFGYSIRAEERHIVWAPEFLVFPEWASHSDLMFADAAGWDRAIHSEVASAVTRPPCGESRGKGTTGQSSGFRPHWTSMKGRLRPSPVLPRRGLSWSGQLCRGHGCLQAVRSGSLSGFAG